MASGASPEEAAKEQNEAGTCDSIPNQINTKPLIMIEPANTQTVNHPPFLVQPDLVAPEITALKLRSPPAKMPALGGRLQHFLDNWQKLTRDRTVLEVVGGYRIPWLKKPVQTHPPSQARFSKQGNLEIQKQIREMLNNQVVKEVESHPQQFLSNLFLRQKKDGSYRPVFNLKKLNSFIPYVHFKMETFQMLSQIIQPKDWMVKIDLKDAYFCVPIAKQCQNFLRFQWENKTYQFQALAFGLGPGPLIFTKIMKVPMGLLRRLGFRMMIYLDDIILFHQDTKTLEQQLHTTIWVLQCLGFVVNFSKSVLTPNQCIEYLGFTVDSRHMQVQLPQEKVKKIQNNCKMMLSQGQTTVRQLAQIIGTLTSTAAAIMPGPLHYRHLQMQKRAALKANRQSYNASVHLSQEMRQDMEWWIHQLELNNGKKIISPNPDHVIETDASKIGWGAVTGNQVAQGKWSLAEKALHINILELRVPQMALKTLGPGWTNCHIHFKMDNKTAVTNLNKMGNTKSEDLLEVTQQLWTYCLEKGITITAEYLPGQENAKADLASREMLRDASDWMLDRIIFKTIENTLGPVTLDLFASRTNAQKSQYVSWKPDPDAIQYDAFSMRWDSNHKMYAFPPFCLISRCLAKVKKEKGDLTIVTPVWQAQPWYAVLLETAIQVPILLPPQSNLLLNTQGEEHPLITNGSLHLAAWKISGKGWKQVDFQSKLQTWSEKAGEMAQNPLTSQPGRNGVAGVLNGKLIPFRPLWQK